MQYDNSDERRIVRAHGDASALPRDAVKLRAKWRPSSLGASALNSLSTIGARLAKALRRTYPKSPKRVV